MPHSQFNHKRLKNDFDAEFDSIADLDNIVLFNRSTLYHQPSPQQSWLSFFHSQRIHNQRIKRNFTLILTTIVTTFSILSLVFLIATLLSCNQSSQNDIIKEIDDRLYAAQVKLSEQCQAIPPTNRIDCNPDLPISKEKCEQRGCCWNPISQIYSQYILQNSKALPPVDIPFCYYNPSSYNGYKIIENRSESNHYFIHLRRNQSSGFPNDVDNVRIDIDLLTDQMMRIKFTDLENPRYEVPVPKLNVPASTVTDKRLYSVELTDSKLVIRRKNNGQRIFFVNLNILIFSNQLLQLTTQLPSDFLYGLGEHREPFRKSANWKRYTMFNRDQYPLPDMALYGSHPFYLTVEEHNDQRPASGVFLFNSNAMDIITTPQPAITFRTIGGILDFFVFLGPKPEDVVSQYHSLIGLPALPPYWSLGFHLSRYGYRNISNLNATFMRNREFEIPMDVQWTDIDAMASNNDFTYDHKNFKGLPEFIDEVLHNNGVKFVPMFDCGISAGEDPNTYPPYDDGIKMDVFIKNSSNQIFYGKVWNRKSTVWPDFFHPNASAYWTKMFSKYHDEIAFDGAWIDMNEPSNFLDGQENGCPRHDLESPPYTPGMVDENLTLRRKTLCMTARHYNGQSHYNLHNLYGFQEAIVTNDALKKTLKKRPFILSRSTAPGHGHWAFHWSGDIVSDWSSMSWSISSMLNFNLFGIPMVGADICGFNGNTTEELCARWHQLGAFYPFARNHNTDNAIDQDPAALGPHVVQAAVNAIRVRYVHIAYLYTLFYNVHKNGGTVVRPLFFEFADDENAYKIESQFLWGKSLMIAPALSPNQTKIEVYFPRGKWAFVGDYRIIKSNGEFISMPASYNYPNAYYRSSSIIPIQKPLLTTELMRKEPFTLLIILDDELSQANGQLYWDDGDSIDVVQLGEFNFYNFSVKDQKLIIESQHLGYETSIYIEEIILIGFYQKPDYITINGDKKGFAYDYDAFNHRLTINNISLPLHDKQQIKHEIYWDLFHYY